MNVVDPIRDEEIVKSIEGYLKNENRRNWLLFVTGLHTGLRVSDIVKIRSGDVYKKNILIVTEQKTKKTKEIALSAKLKREFNKYIEDNDYSSDIYLFKSRKGENRHIKRQQVYLIIKKVCAIYGVENVGTHTLRKTFGYRHYKKYRDIEALRKYFNHANSSVTTRYIGLQQEVINKQVRDLWS